MAQRGQSGDDSGAPDDAQPTIILGAGVQRRLRLTLGTRMRGRNSITSEQTIVLPLTRSGARRGWFFGGGALALAGIAALVIALAPAATRSGTIGEVHVAQGNLVKTLSTSGSISAGIYEFGFLASGQLSEVDVHVGDEVHAGDTLAKLNVPLLKDAQTTAQQQLDAAQSAYNDALVVLQDAQNTQSAANAAAQDAFNAVATPIAGQPTPTPQQLQHAQDTLNAAEAKTQAQVDAAQAQADAAQNQVTLAETGVTTAGHNLANATLLAPADGVIAAVRAEVGENISIDSPINTTLFVLTRLNALQAEGLVDETQITQVQSGWPVSFTVRAYPNQTFYGVVAAISPLPQPTSKGVSYGVLITVDPHSFANITIYPGMTVPSITITTNEAVGALLIPRAAVTLAQNAVVRKLITATAAQAATQAAQQFIVNSSDPAIKGGHPGFVLEQQKGKIIAIPVVLGISDATNIVVLQGLTLGELVVTSA
jgi:HlyD family secretion protein